MEAKWQLKRSANATDNVPPSKAVSALIFPSKTNGLAMRDYEDDDFEEVSKGRYLVGTEDVLDVDEVLKCREGIPALQINCLPTIIQI